MRAEKIIMDKKVRASQSLPSLDKNLRLEATNYFLVTMIYSDTNCTSSSLEYVKEEALGVCGFKSFYDATTQTRIGYYFKQTGVASAVLTVTTNFYMDSACTIAATVSPESSFYLPLNTTCFSDDSSSSSSSVQYGYISTALSLSSISIAGSYSYFYLGASDCSSSDENWFDATWQSIGCQSYNSSSQLTECGLFDGYYYLGGSSYSESECGGSPVTNSGYCALHSGMCFAVSGCAPGSSSDCETTSIVFYEGNSGCTAATAGMPSSCPPAQVPSTPSVDNGQVLALYQYPYNDEGACVSGVPSIRAMQTDLCQQVDVSMFEILNFISEQDGVIEMEYVSYYLEGCAGPVMFIYSLNFSTNCMEGGIAKYGAMPVISAAMSVNGAVDKVFVSSSSCQSNKVADLSQLSFMAMGACYPNVVDEGTSVKTACGATSIAGNVYNSPDCSGTVNAALTAEWALAYPYKSCGASSYSPYEFESTTCAPMPEEVQGGGLVISLCFAASEVVTLESGGSKPLPEVVVGDRVLAADSTGKLLFADVVAVPHASNTVRSHFVRLETHSGRDLKLTPAHLLLAGEPGAGNRCEMASLALISARSISAGMCVLTVEGAEAVAAVELVRGEGAYSLVTSEALVVVNGFVASPFAVNHAVASAFYNVHRMAFALGAEALLQMPVVREVVASFGALVIS